MDGPRSRGYGARSGYDVRTRCIRGCTERRQGVVRDGSGIRRRLPASASDASREALNSSKQRDAPPLPPDLLNLREDYLRICFQYAAQGEGRPTAIRLKVGCAVIHKSCSPSENSG